LRSLERIPGVSEVIPQRTGVTVAYDAGRVSPASMADVVTRETSYRAVVREGRGR
jgi:allophanate hydrolase subunit 1